MGLDALLKRFHVLIVGALVAMAAWLQASGIGQLIGSSLAATDAPAAVTRSAARITGARGRAERSATAILSRNPFDSVTGPLDGSNRPLADLEPPPPPSSQDPYEDPPCSGIKSSLISAADDPDWSFANLTGSDGKSQLRRKGDDVGSAKVHHIGWFPEAAKAESVPRVWMLEGSARCIVEMGAGAKAPAAKPKVASTSSKGGKASALTESINSKIRKVGENSYVVERSAVDEIIKNYAQLAGSLRTRQTKDGMRMSGIRSNSVLNTIGMKNGDVLKSINGFDMNDPDKAVEAYGRLRSVKSLTVTVDRGGSPMTIDLAIQ